MERFNKTQKNLLAAILAIILFVGSTAVSYSVFASHYGVGPLANSSYLPTPSSAEEEDPNAPKTAMCPLNGSMHTDKAKQAWSKRRPLVIMIENSTDARPQSGISKADIIYEAVAEGGITRFMALFDCNLGDIQVGPVRSARTYFLDWESEYDGLYAHVGGANTPGPANALGQIIDYKVKDLNQFSIGFPTFWRDYDRLRKADGSAIATEHTMYSSTAKLWKVGQDRGWASPDSTGAKWEATFVPWKFKDPAPTAGTGKPIEVHFWDNVGYAGDYTVVWNYDQSCGCYKRKNGGVDHMDKNNNQQIAATNVVVQYLTESRANDGYENNVHLLYGTKGEGKAVFFQDGKVITGKWSKPTRIAREKFVDDSGKEIEFVKGQIWIENVPAGSKVAY